MEISDRQESICINYENILDHAGVDMLYLFVDKAEVVPGREARGVKLASTQDWYFKLHFPGDPMMPGLFIMESIMITGSFILSALPDRKGKRILFNGCKDARIYRSVRPGDILESHVVLDSCKRGVAFFHGEAYVGKELVCRMGFTLTIPAEVPRMRTGASGAGGPDLGRASCCSDADGSIGL